MYSLLLLLREAAQRDNSVFVRFYHDTRPNFVASLSDSLCTVRLLVTTVACWSCERAGVRTSSTGQDDSFHSSPTEWLPLQPPTRASPRGVVPSSSAGATRTTAARPALLRCRLIPPLLPPYTSTRLCSLLIGLTYSLSNNATENK